MHFLYIDESGDTGTNLADDQQPILVLGGIGVKDAGWMKTQSDFDRLLRSYFNDDLPGDFELHAAELLSPNGDGPFDGHPMQTRSQLARDVLDLLDDRGHSVHYFAVNKHELAEAECASDTVYDSKHPWLLAYDYLITYLNAYVKERLGHTARGMVIHDEKEHLQQQIATISHERRFEGPKTHRVKWIVEFSYPVDSRQNPMVQMSDLVAYCIRKFIEIEHGFCPDWSPEAKQFYADCFGKIDGRIHKKSLVERGGAGFTALNEHLGRIRATPGHNWRARWLT